MNGNGSEVHNLVPISSPGGIIAVTDDSNDATGAIVFWRLSSGGVRADHLTNAWLAARLDPDWLVALPGPESALRRAVKELEERHVLVRKTREGWAVVYESIAGKDPEYSIECSVSLDAVKALKVEPQGHPLEPTVRAAFDRFLEELTSEDISGWLTRTVQRRANAVALRDTGGVYFIPRPSLDIWRQVAGAIRSATNHQIHEIPAMRSADAVQVILSAIDAEASAEAADFERAIDENQLGERGFKSRMAQCERVMDKVATYESLLGQSITGLRARLEEIKSNLAAAALTASLESDA